MTRRFEGHSCDILGISLRGEAILEQIENGRSIWRGPAPGSVVLLQANQPTDWALDGDFEMLHVYLPHHVNRGNLLPIAQRPFRDTLLVQLAQTTALALQETGSAGSYIFPLLESISQFFEERYVNAQHDPTYRNGSGLTGFVQKSVLTFIADHLHQEISVDDLAKVAGLSPCHFTRAFRTSFANSPGQFLIDRRVDRAASLLTRSSESVGTIATLCGFSSASHLGMQFRKRMGVTPSVYRRKH
ncbi:MAG: helix-turn-helix domain-containing protein [Novosphingobium sp.]|nr:helix-turn-helix domain-containing protein [Novosphingobium sp.]